MSKVPHLVTVVCTGNICRSPMGERLLAHALAAEESPLKDLEVVSSGVAAYPGDDASPNSVKALAKVGLDLNDHRSRRLDYRMMDESVLVLVMTEGHRQIIQELYPESDAPVLLFRELIPGTDTPEVPDPYGASLPDYIETRDALMEAIPSIVGYLRENAQG